MSRGGMVVEGRRGRGDRGGVNICTESRPRDKVSPNQNVSEGWRGKESVAELVD